MIDLYVYQFDKRTNSTSIPADNTGYLIKNVKLKENTSLLHPIFIVNANTISVDSNYIKMEREGYKTRFYFIDDIFMCVGNIAEVRCTQDHLATWKSEIGNSTQYVTRAYSDVDYYISDTLYPMTTRKECKSTVLASSLFNYTTIATSGTTGLYVVGIRVENSQGDMIRDGILTRGGVAYVAMTAYDFYSFDNDLIRLKQTPTSYSTTPFEYIMSCIFVPVPSSIGTRRGTTLHLIRDVWAVSLNYIQLSSAQQFITINPYIGVPSHPQRTSNSLVYLDAAPYSVHTLACGPFGSINIDRTLFVNLHVAVDVDILSGDAVLYVNNTSISQSNKLNSIIKARAQIGIPIQLTANYETNSASARMQIGAAVGSSLISLGIGAIKGGVAGAAIAGASMATSIPSLLNAIATADATKPLTFGANGTFIDSQLQQFQLLSVFQYISETAPSDKGYPLCKNKKINELNGYILCDDADIYLKATHTEIEAIKSYMNTGFFYN